MIAEFAIAVEGFVWLQRALVWIMIPGIVVSDETCGRPSFVVLVNSLADVFGLGLWFGAVDGGTSLATVRPLAGGQHFGIFIVLAQKPLVNEKVLADRRKF